MWLQTGVVLSFIFVFIGVPASGSDNKPLLKWIIVIYQLVQSRGRTNLAPPYNLLTEVAGMALVVFLIGNTENAKTREVNKEYFVTLFYE